jgi:hypothetical protein
MVSRTDRTILGLLSGLVETTIAGPRIKTPAPHRLVLKYVDTGTGHSIAMSTTHWQNAVCNHNNANSILCGLGVVPGKKRLDCER